MLPARRSHGDPRRDPPPATTALAAGQSSHTAPTRLPQPPRRRGTAYPGWHGRRRTTVTASVAAQVRRAGRSRGAACSPTPALLARLLAADRGSRRLLAAREGRGALAAPRRSRPSWPPGRAATTARGAAHGPPGRGRARARRQPQGASTARPSRATIVRLATPAEGATRTRPGCGSPGGSGDRGVGLRDRRDPAQGRQRWVVAWAPRSCTLRRRHRAARDDPRPRAPRPSPGPARAPDRHGARAVTRVGVTAGQVEDPRRRAARCGRWSASTRRPSRAPCGRPGRRVRGGRGLRRADYRARRARLRAIPGFTAIEDTAPLAPSRRFARALLGDGRRRSPPSSSSASATPTPPGDLVGQSGLQAALAKRLGGHAGAARGPARPRRHRARHAARARRGQGERRAHDARRARPGGGRGGARRPQRRGGARRRPAVDRRRPRRREPPRRARLRPRLSRGATRPARRSRSSRPPRCCATGSRPQRPSTARAR